MTSVNIPRDIDRFVIYFDTPRRQVNAIALATALVGLSDAVREANMRVNPGYSVEVVVEALDNGSFQAAVRTVYTKGKDLFSSEPVKCIVYGIIAAHIYQNSFAPDTVPTIITEDDQVVIESGEDRVIIPKEVFEEKEQLQKSERFRSSVENMVAGAKSDDSVEGLALKQDVDQPEPDVYLPRNRFSIFERRPNEDQSTREVVEYANLEISRAILSRGNRKWEFYWHGVKVSAPVVDDLFFDKFFAHEITIAPGDVLKVALKITQEKHSDTGIFVNKKYEVIEVFEHIPRTEQSVL